MQHNLSENWEQRAVDEIIAEENTNGDNIGCEKYPYSPSWLCPCCGVSLYVLLFASTPDCDILFQVCSSCQWESELYYDC